MIRNTADIDDFLRSKCKENSRVFDLICTTNLRDDIAMRAENMKFIDECPENADAWTKNSWDTHGPWYEFKPDPLLHAHIERIVNWLDNCIEHNALFLQDCDPKGRPHGLKNIGLQDALLMANDIKSPHLSDPYQSKKLELGQEMPDGTIFVGTWDAIIPPVHRHTLGENEYYGTYNLFIPPKDLTNAKNENLLMNFNEAAKKVAHLKHLHGHDGFEVFEEKQFYNAIKNKEYKNQWVLPPADILEKNIFGNKDLPKLKGTFTEKTGERYKHWYWSCTSDLSNPNPYAVAYHFAEPHRVKVRISEHTVRPSTRPVRFVPRL